jgi:DNA-binding PadR family transcriptional regulator
MSDAQLLDAHRQELRRGTVVLACLLALRQPGYGYGLLKTLEAVGIPSDANTIYPLLRRLEEKGLLNSQWNTDDSRPRKFYSTSAAGEQLAEALMREMTQLGAALRELQGGQAR